MARSLVFSLLVCTLFVAMLSCRKKVPQASQADAFEGKEDSLVAPLSFFSIKIAIEAKALQNKLDQELKGVLQEGQAEEEDLFYRVSKRGNLSLRFENEEVKYEMPLNVYVKYGLDFLGAKRYVTSDMDVLLKFKSKIALDSNFKLSTQSFADGFQFLTDPVVVFSGIKIPIKGVLDVMIRKNQPKLAVLIDDYVNKEINTLDMVKQVWGELQQEFLISPENNLFFKAIPQKIKISDLKFKNQQLQTSVAISTVLLTKTGGFGKSSIKPLPKLETQANIPSSSELNVVSALHYDELGKMANANLKAQVFEFQNGKRKVKVEDIKVSGRKGKIVADVELSGNVADKISLMGVPYFDNEKKEIRVKNLEYKLETKKRLIKKANWLLKSSFEKKMEKQMVFSVKKDLEETERSLKDALKKFGQQNGVSPNFAIRKIEVKEMNTKKDKVEILLQILSDFELKVDRID